jgi:hypothetical protein
MIGQNAGLEPTNHCTAIVLQTINTSKMERDYLHSFLRDMVLSLG